MKKDTYRQIDKDTKRQRDKEEKTDSKGEGEKENYLVEARAKRQWRSCTPIQPRCFIEQ